MPRQENPRHNVESRMKKPALSRSAKWGKACAPCAVAKTRCIRSREPAGAAQCDRCLGLGRNCLDQVPGPRKKRRQVNSWQSLGLCSIPRSQATPDTLFDSKAAVPETRLSVPSSSPNYLHESVASNVPQIFPASSKAQYQGRHILPHPSHRSPDEAVLHTAMTDLTAGSHPPCPCRVPLYKADFVTLESDETLLSIYMNHLSLQFPFIIIHPGTTAKQLQETKPFLMQVIRMAASVRHLRSMWAQSRAIIQHLSSVMLIKAERSLDLLQGILVFLSLYHYFCMSHAHFNTLIHLAISLVGDLDLDSPPKLSFRENNRRLLTRSVEPITRTNEERRTILGAWYMSSNGALAVKQLGPTRYTKYLDQCVKELESAAEYETDQLAVHLVRIQHLTERIYHFHTRDQLVDDMQGFSKPSTAEYLQAFQAELEGLRDSLPLSLKSNDLLTCHYNSAHLQLVAPLLSEEDYADAELQSLCSLTLAGLSPLEIVTGFTTALNTWFDVWLAVPVCSYFYLPQPISFQMVHASRSLIQWARLFGPDAVSFCRTGRSSSGLKPRNNPRQYVPVFMGLTPCPELGLSMATAKPSGFNLPTQPTLGMIRAEVFVRPELQVDIIGIAEAMANRFEAAKKEMAAAQGGVWNNDTWNAAAEQMRYKISRIEKWCDVAAAAEHEASQLLDFSGGKADGFHISLDGETESYQDQDDWHLTSGWFDAMDTDILSFLDVAS
ncbi:hypothetical protein S40288_09989 [Stachybotrys chartarum IBT 40288]|nr:hypothetical protein S40288_09989 [Stachybotrys chartarum IBT 40288]